VKRAGRGQKKYPGHLREEVKVLYRVCIYKRQQRSPVFFLIKIKQVEEKDDTEDLVFIFFVKNVTKLVHSSEKKI